MSIPRIVEFPVRASSAPAASHSRVRLVAIESDGSLVVEDASGLRFPCDWLDNGQTVQLAPGDTLLALAPDAGGRGVVLGRIGPYRQPQPQAHLTLEATESLTLKCGEVSVDMRAADGKLMLRGEDVLLRAKGTQRIRAGNVAIN